MEDIHKDIQEQFTGMHLDSIAKVVSRLHVLLSPNTNPVVASMFLHKIIDTFWNEFKAFQNGTHPYPWAEPLGKFWHVKKEFIPTMAQKVFDSKHIGASARICGMSCNTKTLWLRSCREELGRSEASQRWENVSPQWQVHWEENKHLVWFVEDITCMIPLWSHETVECDGTGGNFGDDDINFDLQSEKFGV